MNEQASHSNCGLAECFQEKLSSCWNEGVKSKTLRTVPRTGCSAI